MISTAEAPSVICDELPAVTRPVSGNEGRLEFAERFQGRIGADALVGRDELPVGAHDLDDLVLEAAFSGGPGGTLVRLRGEGGPCLRG